MSKFDDELRLALRREEPSPDFTSRVMMRIAQLPKPETINQAKIGQAKIGQAEIRQAKIRQEKLREENNWWQKLSEIFRPPQAKWAMVGAMAVVLVFVAIGLNQYRQRQIEARRQAEIAAQTEGERAKEQVMLAMRIASAKLNLAQKKVQESTQRDDGHTQAEHQQN